MKSALFLLPGLCLTLNLWAGHPGSFNAAKKQASKIYLNNQKTFYCGCSFVGKVINHHSCGLKYRKNKKRSARLEWEHVVPAWHIGHQRKCWQAGGRKNCNKIDPVFVKMTSDLHNLVPSVGEINADRSNFRFSMLEGEKRMYGQCDFEVDFKLRKAEPRPDIRGDIARIYFYMMREYGLKVSKSQSKLFSAWDAVDPISAWEKAKNNRIESIQGNRNCFIDLDC